MKSVTDQVSKFWLVLELNPRGQVAPQVHVSTATPPMRPRGKVAPQSPLEESATTSARWHGNDQLPLQKPVQVPVFEATFF